MCTNQTRNTPHAASTTLLQNKNTQREYPSNQTWSEIQNVEGNTLQYGPWLLQWTTFTLKKMWLHTKFINMIVDQKVHVQIVHYTGHHGSNMKPRNFFWVCKIFGFWAKDLTNAFNICTHYFILCTHTHTHIYIYKSYIISYRILYFISYISFYIFDTKNILDFFLHWMLYIWY